MFFTKAGRIVAWIGTVLGFLAVVQGYEIDINGTRSVFADMFRLDTDQRASMQAKVFINQGSIALFCGLVLGILTEISWSVARRGQDHLQEPPEHR